MIYFPPDCCPKTPEEAFKLQEQTVYLYYHMELVKQAIEVLEEKYFNKDVTTIDEDSEEALALIPSYRNIQLQIEVAATLIDDCLEYIAMLRGEENVYTSATDRTISSRDKIRELHLKG